MKTSESSASRYKLPVLLVIGVLAFNCGALQVMADQFVLGQPRIIGFGPQQLPELGPRKTVEPKNVPADFAPNTNQPVWGDSRLPDPDAGLFTNVALTPPAGGTIVRLQWRYTRASDDPTLMDREIHISAVPLTIVHGLTEDLALQSTVPFIHRRIEFGAAGTTSTDNGVADIPVLLKWRVFQKDLLFETTRFALIGGVEIPSNDSDFSSESLDPIAGVVWTHQEELWWLDWDILYQVNTAGGKLGHDALRYDAAFSKRMLPAELPPERPWSFYGVLELNGAYSTDGSHTIFGSPGLQLITSRVIFEAGVQIPLVQDLSSGRVETDFTTVLSLRFQF